jgi:hypothetical protein
VPRRNPTSGSALGAPKEFLSTFWQLRTRKRELLFWEPRCETKRRARSKSLDAHVSGRRLIPAADCLFLMILHNFLQRPNFQVCPLPMQDTCKSHCYGKARCGSRQEARPPSVTYSNAGVYKLSFVEESKEHLSKRAQVVVLKRVSGSQGFKVWKLCKPLWA